MATDNGHGHHHRPRLWERLRHALVPHTHDAHDAIRSAEEASGEGIRAAWIGLAGMSVTAALQVVIVAVSGSIALLADTLHNLGHLVTTIPLLVAFRLGQRAASRRFSYGYRRAEDLVGLLIGLVIAASAVLVVVQSIDALRHPREIAHLGWVLAAGVVGFLGNEAVAVYRIRAGRRIGSAALVAEGQHARADGLTSITVVAGAVGVWFGFPRADAVAGLLIGVAIAWILLTSMRTVVRRLMDGVEPEVLDRMVATAAAVPGVLAVDRMRARWTGHRMEADAAIGIHADLSVRAGHDVAERVEHALLHTTPHLESVVVHLHPVVDGAQPEGLHALSGHHANAAARAAYRSSSVAVGGVEGERG